MNFRRGLNIFELLFPIIIIGLCFTAAVNLVRILNLNNWLALPIGLAISALAFYLLIKNDKRIELKNESKYIQEWVKGNELTNEELKNALNKVKTNESKEIIMKELDQRKSV